MVFDTPLRYGLVSRILHWGMALLFAWQFTGMGLRLILGRVPLMAFWVGTHAPIGTLLLTLALIRAIWGLINLKVRPPYERNPLGLAALAGHLVLYGFMLVIPTLGLLRLYGSGFGFSPFGIPLFPKTEEKIEWMMLPANMLHGLLAWTFLVMIVGHIAMVLVHRYMLSDDVLPRMAGRIRGKSAPAE